MGAEGGKEDGLPEEVEDEETRDEKGLSYFFSCVALMSHCSAENSYGTRR